MIHGPWLLSWCLFRLSRLVLQDTLDSIYPKVLNFVFVWFCWWLMTKRKMSPTLVMGLLVIVIAIAITIVLRVGIDHGRKNVNAMLEQLQATQ